MFKNSRALHGTHLVHTIFTVVTKHKIILICFVHSSNVEDGTESQAEHTFGIFSEVVKHCRSIYSFIFEGILVRMYLLEFLLHFQNNLEAINV